MAYMDRDAPSYWAESARSGMDTDQARQDAYAAHMARIGAYVTAWHHGELTLEEKRRAISDENETFYGECPKHLIWNPNRRLSTGLSTVEWAYGQTCRPGYLSDTSP